MFAWSILVMCVGLASPTTGTSGVGVEHEPLSALAPLPIALQDKPAEQTYKNIRVLTGMPSSQMLGVMNYMRASLGVRCDYCHTLERRNGIKGWEKDDKPAKVTARRHIQMVFDINRASYGGQPIVTCNTCHQGKTQPVRVPPIGQGALKEQVISPPQAASAEALPTVEEVLDKYVAAVGGRARFEKLKTRVVKGVFVDWDGTSFPLEVQQASPSKLLISFNVPGRGTVAQGFDGTKGWSRSFNGQTRALSGTELSVLKRNAEFNREIRLKELYPSMRVEGKERVNEREAYVVSAQTAQGDTERLYFDAQSGLLLRRYLETPTILGPNPEQTDYEDYREVDGVKLPFVVRISYLDTHISSTRKYTEIKHNTPLPETQFNPPANP